MGWLYTDEWTSVRGVHVGVIVRTLEGSGNITKTSKYCAALKFNKVQTRRAPPRRSVLRGATRGSVYPASRPVPARVRLDASFSARALVSPASATADGPSFSPPT